MNEVIDVEYTEITDLSEKSTEELKIEVNMLFSKMDVIANMGLMLMVETGQRLNVLKARLGHGNWEPWARENLNFSLRKANYMMKYAEKFEDQNSVFFKNANFADIGISKVWALLSASEEVAEEVLQNPELPNMKVKELQEEIQRLKEEKEETADRIVAMDEMIADAEKLQKETEQEYQKRVEELEAEIQIYKEAPAKSEESEKEIARLQAELEKARADAEKEKEKAEKEKEESRKLQENIEAEKKKAAEEAAQFAVEKANAKFEEDNRLLIESNQQAAEEIDRLQKLQENSQEVAEFKVHSDQLQASFLKCLSCAQKVDGQLAENMKAALRTVMEQLTARI